MTRFLSMTVAAFGVLAWAVGAVEPVGQPPVPVGEHPRLFFTARELGAIRQRARSPEGTAMLGALRWQAFGGNDSVLKQVASRDPKFLAEAQSQNGILGAYNRRVWHAALYYQMTGAPADALAAMELLRVWLAAFPPADEIKDEKSWGNPWAAMTYDWLYETMTDEERAKMRRILAAMVGKPTREDMLGKDWWFGGPTPNGRFITNWTAICASSLGVTLLAIEGEEGYNPELLPVSIGYCREFLEGGLAPDGAMYEGLGYAGGYGTKDVPYFLMALRRRGVDLVKTTHLAQVPLWLSYELLPWGYEGFPLNQSNGNLGAGEFLTFFGQEFGGLARWVFHNATGRTAARIAIDPGIGFLNGWPAWRNERPDKLPLGHWFSTRGQVFSRSGWGPRDASFVMNTNPLGAGHTHADQGSFCLASNGALFIGEGGVSLFTSDFHNLVLIDGRGQAESQSRVDAFLRSADLSAYADICDVDQKLAYDRRLEGDFAGPWTWVEYNPVHHAERRSLFVRGSSGPFVVIADDLRKDDTVRAYDWLAHVPEHHVLTAEGRQFRIAERFGGKWLESLEPGAKTTLVRQGVKPGIVRGWALVRGLPHVSAWCSNNLRVNGKLAPYNTAYFGLGFHYRGWYWLPIRPLDKHEVELTADRLELELECATGGQVALAVFSYRSDWAPADEIPADGGDFIVLTVADAVHSDKPWLVAEAPRGVCQGAMLGAQAPALSVRPDVKAHTRRLQARQQRAGTRFLAVLAPHDEGDGRILRIADWGGGEAAELRGPGGIDLVAGAVDRPETVGRLVTDAAAATVSLAPDGQTVNAFAMAGGTKLVLDGKPLAMVTGRPAHVVNDGKTLILRGSGGSSVAAAALTARTAMMNGTPGSLAVKGGVASLELPVLPAAWQVAISDDGRTVEVTGNGPQPLWIEAPAAVYVKVNGVQRYFLRSVDGQRVCPPLELGSPFPYTGEISGEGLAQSAPAGQARLGDLRQVNPESTPGQALVAEGGAVDLQLAIPGPGGYKVTVWYLANGPVSMTLGERSGPRPLSVEPKGVGLQRLDIEGVQFAGRTASLALRAAGPLAVSAVVLQPEYRALPANLWSTAGPFPSGYSKEKPVETEVALAMATQFGPEKTTGGGFLGLFGGGLDLRRSYEGGVDGKPVAWQQSDSIDGAKMKDGIDFAVRCGVLRSQICYAVTYLTCPEERMAEFALSCDYWASGWLNGQPLISNRDPEAVRRDHAAFKGLTRYRSRIILRKGVNELLVKVHGGMGGSSFTAEITDPGDLVIVPTR